ncbi:hypothetical protein LDC_2979 [sediment metagenome]|uniref:Uncharacterized protein n=1 Tax=sediment metagenome TaxID=749907 RepID=D9PN50_9ZZZZ
MIEEILNKVLKFEGANESEKFARQFVSLYGIELYKDGLDLILTKAKQGGLSFEVKIVKGWDTNQGCYLTDQRKIYNKFLKTFTHSLDHKIIIRNFAVNVLAHEMAHCLEVESGLVLNEDFRKAIGFDMKNRQPESIVLAGEIQRLMVDALKSYPSYQFISELFARYFELLSTSRDVAQNGAYTTMQIMEFFVNTSKWIREVFNPKIRSKIDQEIAAYTANLIANNEFKTEKKFADNAKSFYKKVDGSGQKSWSRNVNSNANWQESWNKHQELEDKK